MTRCQSLHRALSRTKLDCHRSQHFLMSSEVTPHSTLQPRFNNSILESLEAKTPPLRKQRGIFISHSHETKHPSLRNTRPLPLQLLPAPCFHALASDRGLEKGVGACREETRGAAAIGFQKNYKGQRQNETLQAANGGEKLGEEPQQAELSQRIYLLYRPSGLPGSCEVSL